jgi:transposase
MKPTSSSQHSSVTLLLQEGYSLCQIELKTGPGKSTVGRIKKEIDSDKENSKGGCPSKLSSCDQQAIICQITTGKLDNAVQAAQYINTIVSSSVSPQTVRRTLKKHHFHSVIKQKRPLLKQAHGQT